MCENFTYCPICQLPLKAISISPDVHVSLCMTKCEEGELEECPEGIQCLSTDIFHYRDFSHKLLAAYRSSSDFVPPLVDIQPSPTKKRKTPVKLARRESPRKANKTPEKKKTKRNATTESDSDTEALFEAKKPRRNLRFQNKVHPISKETETNKSNTDKPSLKSNSVKQSPNSSTKKSLSKPVLRSHNSKPLSLKTTNKASQPTPSQTTRSSQNNLSQTVSSSTSNHNSQVTIANDKLNANEELCLQSTIRSTSPLSSMSVTTTSTNQFTDSDTMDSLDTENGTNINNVKSILNSKIVLKEPILLLESLDSSLTATMIKATKNQFGRQASQSENNKDSNNYPLANNKNVCNKQAECQSEGEHHSKDDEEDGSNTLFNITIKRAYSQEVEFDNDKDSSVQNEENISLSKEDFDDIIPGSTLDKELLKTVTTKSVGSSSTSLHSCSEYNDTATSASSVTEDHVSGDRESCGSSVRSSSPDIVKPTRRKSALLSSSSDSDLPLASIIQKNPLIKINGTEVKSKLRSGIMCLKNNNGINITGKEKAGKILRTPNKTPSYIFKNSPLQSVMKKDEIHGSSDKESDSGKSSASKDGDGSFVPSERSSSSNHSDSAFSAECTDRLTVSSVSSTYTSSEDNSFETRSSDPSFYESDISTVRQRTKSKNSSKKNQRLNTCIKRSVKPLAYSDSSSSEISRKEMLLFKKSSKHDHKSKDIKPSSRIIYDSTNIEDKTGWQLLLNKMRNDCFPSDLKIDSEDSLTVASSCSGSDTSHSSMMLPLRQCPFYKRIPDTPFAVDAFQYWNIPGVKVYFLSHFHSDHYIGLKKNFSHPIYCTKITANLVRMKLRVQEKWLRILELNEPQIISGVEVTALDANHCPGSVMLLFSLTNGRSYLHVGDFRASKSMTMIPILRRVSISSLFLDTTYCSPQYCFPTQEEVISKVVAIVSAKAKQHPRTLVVCGSYLIGKEKVFLGVAEALDWRVWARPEKQRVFGCLNDQRINSRLVKDPRSANVHVLPMASIQVMALQQHLASCSGAFTDVIGIKPTGWENSKSGNFKVTTRDNITIYGVPYSEHSSFSELRDFVQFLQPQDIVPTVNVGSNASRSKMNKYFSEWLLPTSQGKATQLKVSQYFQTSNS